MKKILTVLFALFVCVSLFAGNTVKVVEGKQSFKTILSDKATAQVVIDWSNAKYDKSKSLKDVWGDKYDYFVKACEENLLNGFNGENKELKLTQEKTNAKYVVNVKVNQLDKYFNVMNIVPCHTVKVWATITILSSTGEKQVVIEADEMKGSRDFSPEDCYTKAFKILGERVAKAK